MPQRKNVHATTSSASGASSDTLPAKFGFAQALPLVTFPALGTALAALGMQVDTILPLLGGTGAIGVATVLAVHSGRRMVTAIANGLLHVSK